MIFSSVSSLLSLQHIFLWRTSDFGTQEPQPSSSALFMTLPPQQTFPFLLTVLYSSPSHHTLQHISEKNVVIFHTPVKWEMIVYYFFHLREGDSTGSWFSFIFFYSPAKSGWCYFLLQLGYEERLWSKPMPQPPAVPKHCPFTQHKLVKHSFHLHSWQTPKCSRGPESQWKHFCEWQSHISYAEQP